MFTNIRLFRSPEGDGFGPSLSDIDNPISSGDGTTKPPVLTEAEQTAATDAAAEQAKAAADAAAVEAAKTDETKPEGEGEEDKPEDDQTEGDITPEEFYGTVSKLTGIDLNIDWANSGIEDPLSPEGVAYRDKVILEKGAVDFDAHLRNTSPRAYAYFLHQQAGLSDDQFFAAGTPSFSLPDRSALADSVDLQTSVYKYDLMTKGLDEDTADALVAKAIKENKLMDRSSASYGTIENAQAKQLEDAQRAADAEEQHFKQVVANTQNTINKQMNDLNFIVPEAERPQFQKFVMDNLRVMDGKVYIVQEMDEESRKVQMEALLLQYKKGNLDSVVKRAATTVATQRLRTSLRRSTQGSVKDEGIGSSGKQSLPLSAI